MKAGLIVSMMAMLSMLGSSCLPSNGSQSRVFAHYMPWFRAEPSADGSIKWEHWQWFGKGPKHDPDDVLPTGRRDIASVFYPLIGPYDGQDPAVLEYHVLTAKACGIDGFIADWYGPGNYPDQVFAALAQTAAKYGIKIGICLEEKSFFPGYSPATSRLEVQDVMEKQIRYVLDRYAGSPAYWRINGQPVFLMFNNFQDGILGQHILTPEEMGQVLGRFETNPVFFVRGFLNPAFLGTVQGGYLWVDEAGGRKDFYERAQAARKAGQLALAVGMANPGFDDTGVNGWGNGPRVIDRRGAGAYDEQWEDILRYRPDAAQIVTWNDFEEGSTIEPSEEYGFTFVDRTEHYVTRYTGRRAQLDDNRWPYRIYGLRRRIAALPDEAARADWTARLDSFALDFARGRRWLMAWRLKTLERGIPNPGAPAWPEDKPEEGTSS